MEKEAVKRRKQLERRDMKAHASWVQFWREVSNNTDLAFSPEREDHTAWHLWQAMEQAGVESRSSGWNRRFIERIFGKQVADRLRSTLMKAWREDRPTLRSERSDELGLTRFGGRLRACGLRLCQGGFLVGFVGDR